MKTPVLLLIVLVIGVAWSGLGCAPPPDSPQAADESEHTEPEAVSTTRFGERVLLFMDHPPLVRGEPVEFLGHFSVLATGEPVRSGAVVLQVGDVELAVDAPTREGVFVPEGIFPEAGRFPARLVLTSDQADETFDLGEMVVHATESDAVAAAAGDDHAHDDGIRFLLEQQWKVGLLLARAGPRTVTRRLVVPADVVTAEGASAVVAVSMAGRLLPPDGGLLPRTGDVVAAGDELARVEPPLSATDGAQLRALELEWDMKALEIEKQVAEAESHLRFTEANRARIADLREDGLSTQQQLDQAERDLSLAQGAQAAAQAAQGALTEQRSQRMGALRYPVHAPIAGVVMAEGRVVGEALEAQDTLFRIVDSSRVWIEGRVSEFELPLVTEAPPALVTLPALPGLRLPVSDPFLAPEVDAGSRTVKLRYELAVTGAVVRPGMLAELEVAVESVDADVVIPYEAVVIEGGLPFAYVMHEGEMFERREIELGLRDGDLVEVLAGVDVDERVATRGATTVRLAAMAPASFGHQHQH